MRHVSVFCPKCKDLVPVVDKTPQEHADCPAVASRVQAGARRSLIRGAGDQAGVHGVLRLQCRAQGNRGAG